MLETASCGCVDPNDGRRAKNAIALSCPGARAGGPFLPCFPLQWVFLLNLLSTRRHVLKVIRRCLAAPFPVRGSQWPRDPRTVRSAVWARCDHRRERPRSSANRVEDSAASIGSSCAGGSPISPAAKGTKQHDALSALLLLPAGRFLKATSARCHPPWTLRSLRKLAQLWPRRLCRFVLEKGGTKTLSESQGMHLQLGSCRRQSSASAKCRKVR